MDRKPTHMVFTFYNITPIQGFYEHLNVFDTKYQMLWIFPVSNNNQPIKIINFILATLKR